MQSLSLSLKDDPSSLFHCLMIPLMEIILMLTVITKVLHQRGGEDCNNKFQKLSEIVSRYSEGQKEKGGCLSIEILKRGLHTHTPLHASRPPLHTDIYYNLTF